MKRIAEAVQILKSGRLVVMPTETVYGLAGDARSEDACAKIFETKARPRFNPLICHIADISQIFRVCETFPDEARALAAAHWPGPLTLILPKAKQIADLATAGLPTVGVRIPRHPVARALLEEVGIPLAAPSANLFTKLSPTTLDQAHTQLGDRVSCYLDGGNCEVGLESTILAWIDGRPVVLRPGGLEISAIEKIIGPVKIHEGNASVILAPGMTQKHYSPETPLEICAEADTTPLAPKHGLLVLTATKAQRERFTVVEELSASGNLNEAAAELFRALARLEKRGLDKISAVLVPERGLGIAINDRLRRAAYRL